VSDATGIAGLAAMKVFAKPRDELREEIAGQTADDGVGPIVEQRRLGIDDRQAP